MEDLALSIDARNVEDLMRRSLFAKPELRQDQLLSLTYVQEQATTISHQLSHTEEHVTSTEIPSRGRNSTSESPFSLEDTNRKYVPDGSGLALSMEQRKSTLRFIGSKGFDWGDQKMSDFSEVDGLRAMSNRDMQPGQSSILIITDINIDLCKALCARYPGALHPEHLAGHIIRYDGLVSEYENTELTERDLATRYPGAGNRMSSMGNLIAMQRPNSEKPEGSAIHLRFVVETLDGNAHNVLNLMNRFDELKVAHGVPFRQDVFQRDELNKWRCISMHMSCFLLDSDLYLVLIDSTPQLEGLPLRTANSIGESPSKILRFETWIVPAQPRALANSFFMAGDNLVLGQILNLFKHHTLQSIFRPRSIPVYQEEQIDKRNHLNKHVFVLLLLETSWRVSVNLLQSELNKLQHDATTIAGDRAFKMLAGLRRQLADAYELLAEVHGVVDDRLKSRPIRWNANGVDLQPEAFWSDKRSQSVAVNIRQAKSVDLRDLPDLLEELVGRIKSMTKTVNEEIQIVIGSVQVEDARVMRRQTESTVVLAVLAAIYLPMTLVTGIFGMNITDFSAESTAPDRWSVVNAWGIVFGVTMGSILVYAVVRYALRYWRVGRMLLKRNMKKIGDGWLYRKGFAFKIRVQQLWLYRKIRGFGEKMKEWDVEAQKMEKME